MKKTTKEEIDKDPYAAWALLSLVSLVILISANSFAFGVLHIGFREGDWFPIWPLTSAYLTGYWDWIVGKILILLLCLSATITAVSWWLWPRSAGIGVKKKAGQGISKDT